MAHNLCLNVFNFSLIAMVTSILESLILTEPENAKTKTSIRFSDASNYKRSQVTYHTPSPIIALHKAYISTLIRHHLVSNV